MGSRGGSHSSIEYPSKVMDEVQGWQHWKLVIFFFQFNCRNMKNCCFTSYQQEAAASVYAAARSQDEELLYQLFYMQKAATSGNVNASCQEEGAVASPPTFSKQQLKLMRMPPARMKSCSVISFTCRKQQLKLMLMTPARMKSCSFTSYLQEAAA